jgi:hypothetical protein
MTWPDAVSLLVMYIDGKLVFKTITPALLQECPNLLLDAPQTMHKLYPKLELLTVLDPPSAAFSLCNKILSYVRNVVNALPANGRVVLVFDNESPNPFKAGEHKRRKNLASKADPNKLKALMSDAMKQDVDSPEYDKKRVEFANEWKKDGSLSHIQKPTLRLVVYELEKANDPRIFAVMASGEAEATMANLVATVPRLLGVTTDGDFASFRPLRYVSLLRVDNKKITGTFIDVHDALTNPHFTSRVGGAGFLPQFGDNADVTLACIHGSVGCDWIAVGGSESSRGVAGVQNSTACKIFRDHAATIAALPNKKAAFDFCLNLMFESEVWKKVVKEMDDATQQAKRDEFKTGVLLFYMSPAVALSCSASSSGALTEAFLQKTARARLSHVNYSTTNPIVVDDGNLARFLQPATSAYNEDDFYCRKLELDAEYLRVTDRLKYFPFCGLKLLPPDELKRFLFVADVEILRLVCRALGSHIPQKATRSSMVGFINLRLRVASPENPVKDNGIAYARITTPHSQVVAGGGSTVSILQWFQGLGKDFGCAPGAATGLHKYFNRAGLSEGTATSPPPMTEVNGATKLTLGGHIVLENIKILLIPETAERSRLVTFEVEKVLPSFKSDTYTTQITFKFPKEGIEDMEEIFVSDMSLCSCVAGRGHCSHKAAAMLYVGLIAKLTQAYDYDETATMKMLPSSLLSLQGKISRCDKMFRGEEKPATSADDVADNVVAGAAENNPVAGSNTVSNTPATGAQPDTVSIAFGQSLDDVFPEMQLDVEPDSEEAQVGEMATVEQHPEPGPTQDEVDLATIQPSSYTGDLLSKIVDIVKNGAKHAGFGTVHRATQDDVRVQNAAEVAQLKRGGALLFDFLAVGGNLVKKARVENE